MLDRSVIERYPWIEPRSWELSILREGRHDQIGIWEARSHAADERHAPGRGEFLASIHRLLAAELIQAGHPLRGGGFDAWPGTPQEVVARIDREWQALGRDPSLGDVVCFEATEAGKELGAAWPDLRFTREPRGELFRTLLRWLCGRSREFLLVRRDLGIPDAPSLGTALAALAPWRIAEEEDWRWPGTTLFGGSALVYRHRCEPAAATTLADLASGPFEWRQPALPEDLGFVDARGRALLADVAHERLLILDLSPDELDDLRRQVPGVLDLLRPWP